MIKRAFLVRMKGLEPIRLTAPDPKSGLATNYNTSASQLFKFSKYSNFLRILNLSHLSNSQIPRTFFCPRYPSPKSSPSGRGLSLATRAQKWCFALAKLESTNSKGLQSYTYILNLQVRIRLNLPAFCNLTETSGLSSHLQSSPGVDAGQIRICRPFSGTSPWT